MANNPPILAALRTFADAVSAKMNPISAGEPEDQLRAPFEQFIAEVGTIRAIKIVCTGETQLPGPPVSIAEAVLACYDRFRGD